MSQEQNQTWSQEITSANQRDTLILDFTLVSGGQSAPSSWSVVVRSAQCGVGMTLDGLTLGEVAEISATFRNTLMAAGKLYWRQIGAGRVWVLWTDDLAFGFSSPQGGFQLQHVDGGLIEASERPTPAPAPDPPAPPHPPLPQPSPVPIIEPAMGREGDLFPYQYMRIWPSPSPDELALSFVRYPPVSGLPGGFYRALLGLARAQREEAAVAYIEGEPFHGVTYAPPFASDLHALPLPFGAYPGVLALATQATDRSPAEIVEDIWRRVGSPCADASALLDSPAYLDALASVWQSYFALIIELGYERRRRDDLTTLIIVDHLLRWLAARCSTTPSRHELLALARATIVLPGGAFPLPPAGAVESPPAREDIIVPYAIGDLQMVRQKLVGYALGDLARIESVMAGERRESVSRQRQAETSTAKKQSTDKSMTAKRSSSSSLTTEVQGSIADTLTTAKYTDFSTTYGPSAQATLNGSWTIERRQDPSSGGASAPSERDRFAKDVVERTAQRVARRVIETRTVSASRESEESLTRVLDNTAGTVGRRGIYRWLNEVHEARVVHYGSRLVLELLVPAPAARYCREEIDVPHDQAPPVPPAAIGIESYEDVSTASFPLLAARYPSEAMTLPPAPRRAISGWARSGEPLSLTLPEGYEASEVRVGYVLLPGQASHSIQGIVGRTTVSIPATTTSVTSVAMNQETGIIQILLQIDGPSTSPPTLLEPVQLSVEIDAAPSPEAIARWQLGTFQAIHAAYAAQLDAYEGKGGRDEPGSGLEPRVSCRAIERRELHAASIDLLFRVLRARTGAPEDVPSGWPERADVARPRHLQFFERAFEWGEISYSFLDDKEARHGHRGAPAQGALHDDRFLEFLNATHATVLLPVSPSEAMAVLYFLASGTLWDGAETPTFEPEVALVNELKKLSPVPAAPRPVGEPWKVVVPTAISVLEDGTGSLEDLCQPVRGG